MKKKYNKLDHFTKKKYSSRLVRRVFTTSLLCLVVPLVIYSLVVTRVYYNKRALSVFDALSNVTQEKIHLFSQVIKFNFSSMYSVDLILSRHLLEQDEARQLLMDYAEEFFIGSVFFLTQNSTKSDYEVSITSEKNLPQFNFTQFVTQYGLDRIKYKFFIAPNLKGEDVLFLSHTIFDQEGDVVGILLFDVHFESLVSSIFYLQEWKNMVVSLLDDNNVIMASTDRYYDGFSVTINEAQTYRAPNTMMLRPEKKLEDAYAYELQGISYLAVVKPIPNSNMKLMTIVPKTVLYSPIKTLVWEILILLLCILVIGGGLLYFFMRKLSKPINQIHHCMKMVSEGDLTYKYKPMRMGFEINSIGEVFNETIDKLLQVMTEVKSAKVNEEVLAKELSLGQEVQRSLLPHFLSGSGPLEASGKFVSAKQVGGDCYDFYRQDEQKRTIFFISDTAGKGVMACLYALGLRSLLRAYGEAYHEIEKIIVDTNNTFAIDTAENGVFVTAWYGMFDEQTRQLQYSSVGHPPTLLMKKNGDIEKLSTDGIAFGATHIDHVEIKEVTLDYGDILILYTDGVIEAQNAAGQYYTMERLISFLRGLNTNDPHEISDLIHENVLQFSQGEEQFDDLTLLVIKMDEP